jgi:hypothetical protein
MLSRNSISSSCTKTAWTTTPSKATDRRAMRWLLAAAEPSREARAHRRCEEPSK